MLQIAGVKGKGSGALRVMGQRFCANFFHAARIDNFFLKFDFESLIIFRKFLGPFDSCNRASLPISPW